MTTNPIEELAKQSKPAPVFLPGVPKIRHAIQKSEAHRKLATANVVAKKGFQLIDREAFSQTYRDEAYGVSLPVFGFFNVLREPEIRYEFNDPNYQNVGMGMFSTGSMPYFDKETGEFSHTPPANPPPPWTGLRYDNVDKIKTKQLNKFFPPPLPGHERRQYRCKQISFTAELQHIIPEHVVALIDKHTEEKTFNDGVYVVAEVRNCWTMEQREVRMNPDPLLVGVDYLDGKSVFYLLAKFDLTPAESYVTKEFTI